MNFFYRFCARYVRDMQEAMKYKIEEKAMSLNHARYCYEICGKARAIAARYNGINAPTPTEFTPQEIEILIHFVDLKVSGSRVNWEETIKEHEVWFRSNGLPIPPKQD